MKYKVTYPRIVTEAQLVEAIVEADNEEEAAAKVSTNDFERFLVVKKELRSTNNGRPEFEEI